MTGYLIKDTTIEERKKIVEDSLGCTYGCDGGMESLINMYQDYIDGKMELRDINMKFNARYELGGDQPTENTSGHCMEGR